MWSKALQKDIDAVRKAGEEMLGVFHKTSLPSVEVTFKNDLYFNMTAQQQCYVAGLFEKGDLFHIEFEDGRIATME